MRLKSYLRLVTGLVVAVRAGESIRDLVVYRSPRGQMPRLCMLLMLLHAPHSCSYTYLYCGTPTHSGSTRSARFVPGAR